MKTIKLSNVGLKGWNSDFNADELPAEYLTELRNVRVLSGAIQAAGGSKLWSTPAAGFNAGFVMPVNSINGDYWLVAGRDSDSGTNCVFAFDGTNWTNISNSSGYDLSAGDEHLWTGVMLGQIPIINNPQHSPEYWAPVGTSSTLSPLPFDPVNDWADKGYSFKILRAHRNFLFALNLVEGGNEEPDSFRWSHPADINGLPVTWDEADDSKLAGKAALGGNGGSIVDGLSLRNSFCLYSQFAINILDYVGGELVWQRRELSSSAGLISANAVIEIKGSHFLLADGDILRNDGTSVESIIQDRLRRRFTRLISPSTYGNSFAVRNTSRSEVWFCVPEDGATWPNVAYVYNYRNDAWTLRDLPDGISYADYGARVSQRPIWSSAADNWDDSNSVWGGYTTTPLDDTVVGINPTTSALHQLDVDDSDEDYTAYIERTDYPIEGVDSTSTITRCYPHMLGSQPVTIRFGSQQFAGGSIRWESPQLFVPSEHRKIDFRATGELHGWRIESTGKGFWEFSGMTLEYTPAGKR